MPLQHLHKRLMTSQICIGLVMGCLVELSNTFFIYPQGKAGDLCWKCIYEIIHGNGNDLQILEPNKDFAATQWDSNFL